MSKLAYFNPKDNNRILQWMDTDAYVFNLPDASLLHQCTDAEWALQEHGDMMVTGDAVVPFVASAPDLAQVKAAKWEVIKGERDRIKAGGVKVGTKWFHSDEASKIQQIGLVMMGANIPAGLMWKTMDGSFVTMTPALANQVFAAVVAHEQAVFAAAETHNTAMRASVDPAAYEFSSGWPATYAEATP